MWHCRLENGLNKLHKTQSEVDVLVENARAMAIDVEQKVASANVFAEQVREVAVQNQVLGPWAWASPAGIKCTATVIQGVLSPASCCMQCFAPAIMSMSDYSSCCWLALSSGWCRKGEGQRRE